MDLILYAMRSDRRQISINDNNVYNQGLHLKQVKLVTCSRIEPIHFGNDSVSRAGWCWRVRDLLRAKSRSDRRSTLPWVALGVRFVQPQPPFQLFPPKPDYGFSVYHQGGRVLAAVDFPKIVAGVKVLGNVQFAIRQTVVGQEFLDSPARRTVRLGIEDNGPSGWAAGFWLNFTVLAHCFTLCCIWIVG